MEFPNISMPGMYGIAPSTGINRSRKYSSIRGNVYAFLIGEFCPVEWELSTFLAAFLTL
jgi:hypothetical protein